MLLIVFNLSFVFLAATNIFPSEAQIVQGHEVATPDVNNTFAQIAQMFQGTGVGGILGALAGLIGVAATRSWSPFAVGIFSGVFWGSIWDTSQIVSNLLEMLGGVSYFYIIFFTIGMFLYVATIMQMLGGGIKTYE